MGFVISGFWKVCNLIYGQSLRFVINITWCCDDTSLPEREQCVGTIKRLVKVG
jgi:hypothetical protein